MPITEILDLIIKGLGVIGAAVEAGTEVAPAVKVLIDLAEGAKTGAVTDDQLAAIEATLDQLLVDFNTPMTE